MRNTRGRVVGSRRRFLFAIAAAAATLPAGCGRWAARSGASTPVPFAGGTPTADDVARVVNDNAARVRSLYVKDLDISVRQAGQIVPPLDGRMAMEKPAPDDPSRRVRFRLTATSLAGREADLGSNDEEFWCYVRRAPEGPQLIHCSYIDYGRVRQSLPIQPDWIVDSIGLTPVPITGSILQPGKRGGFELVTPTRGPQGQPAYQVTAVDARTGWIVERRLEANGKPVALAFLSKHRADPAFGAVIPRSITIQWPDAGLELAIDLEEVAVNPQFDPAYADDLWRMPREQLGQETADIDLGAAAVAAPTKRSPGARLNRPEVENP